MDCRRSAEPRALPAVHPPMFTKKSKVPPKPEPSGPTPEAAMLMRDAAAIRDKAERLRKHRELAPPDVAAAYELVAEYERRCP